MNFGLSFSVIGARVERYAAAPQLTLRLRIEESTGARVHAIVLRAQVMLQPHRRRYADDEAALLVELFGPRERYGDTLRPMLWTHLAVAVTEFSGSTEFDLQIPCSYDFEVAAHKYLSALGEGEIPMDLLFSGTLFVETESGVMASLVPWTCEARYGLPVAVWREAMDIFFPGSAWLRVDQSTFNELRRYKASTGLPTWEAAITRLLADARVQS